VLNKSVDATTSPLDWKLVDNTDQVVAQGKTTPYRADTLSGQNVQKIDFGN
jgi:hypothetical protein